MKKEKARISDPGVVQNRFTGRVSSLLGKNMFYPFLLDLQATDPAKDFVFFLPVFPVFYKRLRATGKWSALHEAEEVRKELEGSNTDMGFAQR